MGTQQDQARLTELFRRNLELCEVGPGETVAVLSEGDQLDHYRQASLAAARDLGADVADVHLASDGAEDPAVRIANIGQNALSKHPEAMQTCLDADMVVDHMLLLFSHEQISDAGGGLPHPARRRAGGDPGAPLPHRRDARARRGRGRSG